MKALLDPVEARVDHVLRDLSRNHLLDELPSRGDSEFGGLCADLLARLAVLMPLSMPRLGHAPRMHCMRSLSASRFAGPPTDGVFRPPPPRRHITWRTGLLLARKTALWR
jgi:hypothetical protein